MNYIIPMMGKGNRFAQAGYHSPKPLIYFNGEPLIQHVIKRIPRTECKILLVVSDSLVAAGLVSLLTYLKDSRITVLTLHEDTEGAAHTALLASGHINPSEPVCVIDCDVFPPTELLASADKDLNMVFYHLDEMRTGLFSYISTGEVELVTAVVEKEPISDKACSGIYWFRTGETLAKYAKLVYERGVKTKGEFYMSQVVNELAQKEPVYAVKISDYQCVGTPQQMNATYRAMKHEPKIHCVDLDGTLCEAPIQADYNTCKPIQHRIDFFNSLYDAGHTIIIHTARGQLSMGGNIGLIERHARPVIESWLQSHGVKYHQLVMGKPYADLYYDDKAVNVNTHDLQKATGIYLQAEVEPRSQNRITLNRKTVVKSGPTIHNEAFFYANVPESAAKYFPQLLRTSQTEIEIERIEGVTASSMYVANQLTRTHLVTILEALKDIHGQPIPCRPKETMYAEKTRTRAEQHQEWYTNMFQDNRRTYLTVMNYIPAQTKTSVVHGDPVFTNIILNNIDVRFIDPRGTNGKKKTIYGDPLYDYAKVYQSIIGYDHLLNGEHLPAKQIQATERFFMDYGLHNNLYTEAEMKSRVVHLLYSLLPLHQDNPERCKRMYNLLKKLIYGTE